MPSFRTLLSTATALSLAATTQGRPLEAAAAAADCNCYKASADSNAYFANRKFFDFRNIANPVTTAPINGRVADAAAANTHEYFSSAEWTDTFSLQKWETTGEGVYRVNSYNNVLIAPSDGQDEGVSSYLTMRTQRQADYQSTAEVETISSDYQFLTVRMLARTRGSPGAVTALFTYKGEPVEEGDIEIRTTTATNVVQYTNQPGSSEGATTIVELPTPWTEWQEHRYDWTPGSSDWYVDGQKVASIQLQAPTSPLSVLMNVWSDGGVWSGVMDVGGAAEMQVQWLDLTYNSTSQPGTSCANVCVIDDLI
ncbi:concanavalin A-like lectin/glucanase domain-containing protein [Xylaria bambusicola]|uniref:concanavalin A-like lectin/glucanase domain-containing protein n=1 Tax=Xylaria bambusicola TaxID=326684 RepID=UPI002008BC77|nr:concanavalin A-like lectin/glucanase domain-containing protein [Xylaria bambusicola]KAI0509680.1 concanavalin A-like lectin/glucanase domain-containing protein [Xylaria bambusicola]